MKQTALVLVFSSMLAALGLPAWAQSGGQAKQLVSSSQADTWVATGGWHREPK